MSSREENPSIFNMAQDYLYPNGSLRQDCLNILQHHHPDKKQIRYPGNVPTPLMYSKTLHNKQEFLAKNDVYVHSLRGVIKEGKDASIRRNIQATENFLKNLLNPSEKKSLQIPEKLKKQNTVRKKSRKSAKLEVPLHPIKNEPSSPYVAPFQLPCFESIAGTSESYNMESSQYNDSHTFYSSYNQHPHYSNWNDYYPQNPNFYYSQPMDNNQSFYFYQ